MTNNGQYAKLIEGKTIVVVKIQKLILMKFFMMTNYY